MCVCVCSESECVEVGNFGARREKVDDVGKFMMKGKSLTLRNLMTNAVVLCAFFHV